MPAKPGRKKNCKACGAPLVRKRYGNRMEDRSRFLVREHCTQTCANSRATVTRSAHQWRARPHRKPACEECGATEKLHAHHKDRDWANDAPENLQTLCASCHLKLHWREDREQRLAVNPWWRGANMSLQSEGGSAYLADRHRHLPSRQAGMATIGSPPGSQNS